MAFCEKKLQRVWGEVYFTQRSVYVDIYTYCRKIPLMDMIEWWMASINNKENVHSVEFKCNDFCVQANCHYVNANEWNSWSISKHRTSIFSGFWIVQLWWSYDKKLCCWWTWHSFKLILNLILRNCFSVFFREKFPGKLNCHIENRYLIENPFWTWFCMLLFPFVPCFKWEFPFAHRFHNHVNDFTKS